MVKVWRYLAFKFHWTWCMVTPRPCPKLCDWLWRKGYMR